MFGAFGKATTHSAVTFVSQAAAADGLAEVLGMERRLLPVRHTRGITKESMIHNALMPKIEVDPETYEVRANGELLTCAPAEVLPMAQRYFLF
jgi:urease subunit alpha